MDIQEEVKEVILERWELKILIENIDLQRKDFNAPILEKAGHKYTPSTGHSWGNLDSLNDVELFCLYRLCWISYRRSLSKKEYEKEGCKKGKIIHPREVDDNWLTRYGGRKGFREYIDKNKREAFKETIGRRLEEENQRKVL